MIGRVAGPGLLAGVLVALSVPPAGFWPLGILGLALLAWQFDRTAGLWARAGAGFAFGIGLFVITISWIADFQAFGYVGLLVLQSSFFAGAGAATALCRATGPSGRIAAFTGAITLAEALRSFTPWGGFPMAGIPIGQVGGPLAPSARIGGVLVLTALTALLGGAVAEAARTDLGWARRLAVAVAALVPTVAVVAAGSASPDGTPVGSLTVAAVQGGGPRGLRAVDVNPTIVTQRYLDGSSRITSHPDVIVWPEDVVEVNGPLTGSTLDATFRRVARQHGATLLVGVVEGVNKRQFRNAIIAYGPDGDQIDRYDKVHRVPFGEYVPGRDLLDKLVNLRLLPRDAISGHGPGLLHVPGADLGVAISYEVFFGGRSRDSVRAGAQALVVPTNAASYRTSQVPTQEEAAARLRAWETGRDLVQAAPTGYSLLVDPRGHVRQRTTLGRAQVIEDRVTLRKGRTPYVRFGDAPWWILAAILLAGSATASAIRRRPVLDRPVKSRQG